MLRSSDAPLRNSDLIHLRFGLGSGIFRSSLSGPNVCCGDHLLLSGLEILGDGSRGPGISPVPVQRESKGSPCVEVEELTCRRCGICSCGRTACWGIEKGYDFCANCIHSSLSFEIVPEELAEGFACLSQRGGDGTVGLC